MSRWPVRAGLGPQKTPRDIREQGYRHSRDRAPREGGLVLPQRRGEGSPGACSAWDVLLRYTRTPHQKPKGRHPSSPSTPVEPTSLGKLGWLLAPRWGFFDSQRAEGGQALLGRPHFWSHSATKRTHFQRGLRHLGVWSKARKACGGRRGGSGAPRAFGPGPDAGPPAGRPHTSRLAPEETHAVPGA